MVKIGAKEKKIFLNWGQRDRDSAHHPYPLPTHLVEEVDGGKDGEYSHSQGYILGGAVRGQGLFPSFPPSDLPPPARPLLTS